MKILSTLSIVCSFLILNGCGYDDSDNREVDSLKETKTKLETESADLKSRLASSIADGNLIWVVTTVYVDYPQAAESCRSIGFTLPTAQQLENFKKAKPKTYGEFSSVTKDGKPSPIHVINQTQSVKDGVGLCVKVNKE